MSGMEFLGWCFALGIGLPIAVGGAAMAGLCVLFIRDVWRL